MSELTFEEVGAKVEDLPAFIAYLESTSPDEWLLDTVRNVGNTKNCLFGHLINYIYGKDYTGTISPAWDLFEELWSTDFVIYPINDGKDPNYPQATARERIIRYLSDLWLGIRTPTWRGMQLYGEGIYDIDKYEKELAL
jgi:hypothetical protein